MMQLQRLDTVAFLHLLDKLSRLLCSVAEAVGGRGMRKGQRRDYDFYGGNDKTIT